MTLSTRSLLLAALAAASSLTACGSSTPAAAPEPSPGSAQIVTSEGSEVTLALGNTAQLPGANMNIRFDSLLGDSRCPTKALINCLWAGSVRVQLVGSYINGDRALRPFVLESAPERDTATVMGQLVRLVRVTPEKETIDSIPPEAYRIVLQIGAAKR